MRTFRVLQISLEWSYLRSMVIWTNLEILGKCHTVSWLLENGTVSGGDTPVIVHYVTRAWRFMENVKKASLWHKLYPIMQ